MEQKIQADKNEIEMNNRATEMVIEQDRQFFEQEKQRKNERAKLLLEVTAKNKEVRKEFLSDKITRYFLVLVNAKQMGI
jgi:hypothetical protein